MNNELSIALCFLAGLFSFFSPCIFPLIPSYLALLGAGAGQGRFRLAFISLFFILGFGTVFSALSVVLSGALVFISGLITFINIIAGLIVIVLGLNGLLEFLPFLNYEKRLRFSRRGRGPLGGFLAGAAFASGWTPCVGPILGSILLFAGQSGRVLPALGYLAAYTLGLGLPFLAASLLLDRFEGAAKKLRPHLPMIHRISSIFLIALGILIITGRFQALSIFAAGLFRFNPAL
jgi:cytochrome c-type biogenesis protein